MDSVANAGTEKVSWVEIFLVLVVVLPLCFFVAKYANSKIQTERAVIDLAQTVDEVAANLRMSGNINLDEMPPGVANGSAVVARVIKAFELRQITPSHFEKRARIQKDAMALFVNTWRRTGELQSNELVPGVFWRDGALFNAWGGTVTMYRKGDLTLVALTSVPKEICEFVRFRRPLTSYLFACNDDIIAVENGGSSHVDVPKWLDLIEHSGDRAK